MNQRDFYDAVVAIMLIIGVFIFRCLCVMAIESINIAYELTAIREALTPCI